MYRHPNTSTNSTGSARRISTNNPFRSALLQEEREREASYSRPGSTSPTINEAQYNTWLTKHIREEEEEARRDGLGSDDGYYDNDADSFIEGDEYDHTTRARSSSRPTNARTSSESSVRRESYNPFATYVRTERSNSATPANKPSTSVAPPSYDEVVGKKYAKDEYPRDEKNPFPDSTDRSSTPRRAKTVSSRRPAPGAPSPQYKPSPNRLHPDSMTNTTTTRIMSDGRIRSKSTSESSYLRDTPNDERSRSANGSSKPRPSRSHHHHHHTTDRDRDRDRDRERHRERHSSKSKDKDYDDYDDYDRPRRSSTRRKKFVQERSKNLDTIDKLDVTGFFGGGKFHHDGPFDACTPQRNKDHKAPPVAAFPIDGPNNSIKGMAPVSSKNEQYDMVFGIDNSKDDSPDYPVYNTKPRANSGSDALKRGYTNGIVVKRADSADLESLAPASKPTLEQVDAGQTEKLYGDTTLGLGNSTFMDGAPAYGATQTGKEGGLGRKKTLLGRMKTIVRK